MGLFRRQWKLFAFIVAAGLVLSAIYGFILAPGKYSAEVLLYIWDDRYRDENVVRYDDLVLFSALSSDYQVLVTSRLLISQMADKMNLDQDADALMQLMKKIEVSTKDESRHMIISVTDNDPHFAAEAANVLAGLLSDYVDNQMSSAKVQIVDPAIIPSEPISLSPFMILLIGGALSLILGVSVILLPELFDKRIKTSRDIEKITEYSELGSIPQFKRHRSFQSGDADPQEKWIVSGRLETVRLNSRLPILYATILANIDFITGEHPLKMINFTSSQQGEGKSVSAANLAIASARADHEVLLIDADLNQPEHHQYFNLPNDTGLTLLSDQTIDIMSLIKESGIPGLSILTAGPLHSDSTGVLLSKAVWNHLNMLKKKYDLILIDGPSLDTLKDSLILSGKTNGTILVVRHGCLNKEDLARSSALLTKAGANMIGYILNCNVPSAYLDDAGKHSFRFIPTKIGKAKNKQKVVGEQLPDTKDDPIEGLSANESLIEESSTAKPIQ